MPQTGTLANKRDPMLTTLMFNECINARDHVLWTATIRDDLVVDWRVLSDTKANRELLGLT